MKHPAGLYSTSFVVLAMCLSVSAIAQQTPAAPDSTQTTAQDSAPLVYEDPIGVSIDYAPDGSGWTKIYSVGEAELDFGDRKDIQNARREAELKAKAAIVKFFKEKLSTKEGMEEITKKVTDITSSKVGKDKAATEKRIKATTLQISNSAEDILKGVVTLEQKEDLPNKLVTVKVGISRKSMATADSIRNTIGSDLSQPQPALTPPTPSGSAANQTDEPAPTTTIRRSKNANDF